MKAREFLSRTGGEVEERDFFKQPFSREELSDLAALTTADELFSWRSPSAKEYRDRRGQLSDDQLLDLMAGEPRLVRRPIAIRGDRLVLGFNEQALGDLVAG